MSVLLARLRDPADPALERLAELVVRRALRAPVAELVEPAWLAGQIHTLLEGLAGDSMRAWALERVVRERSNLDSVDSGLGDWIPAELQEPLRAMVREPWSPDEALVRELIEQEVVHDLVAEVLVDSLRRFGRKERDHQGRSRKSRLLPIEPAQLVGGLTAELEAAIESRIQDFVRRTQPQTMALVARHLAAPRHARAYGALRGDLLDQVLSVPLRVWSRELDKLEAEAVVDMWIRGLRALLERPDLDERLERSIRWLLVQAGPTSLGQWLEQVDALEAWERTSTELVLAHLRRVVADEDFARWLAEASSE